MRKQRVHAGFRRRRIEDVLGLAIFHEHRVVMVHGYRPIGICVGGDTDAEDDKVKAESDDGRGQHGDKQGEKKSSDPFAQILWRSLGHEAGL